MERFKPVVIPRKRSGAEHVDLGIISNILYTVLFSNSRGRTAGSSTMASPVNKKVWCSVSRTRVGLDPVKSRQGSMCLAAAQAPEEFCIRVIDVEQKLYVEGQRSAAGIVMEK